MQDTTTETGGFRLSPQQEHLLTLGPALGAVQGAAALAAGLDADAVQRAVEAVTNRHEILRTRFVRPAGLRVTQQAIGGEVGVRWSVEERDTTALREDSGALSALLEREARADFDLQQGPVVRAALVHDAGGGMLVLTVSPACADPASLLVLLDDVGEHYRGCLAETEPIQYADYAEWRHELSTDEHEEAQEGRAFWRKVTAEPPEAPSILFGTGARFSGGWRSVPLVLDRVDLKALEQASARTGVSVPVFLEAAWHATLVRLTGASELLTAGWVDGRVQPDIERAVGPYAQPAPIPSQTRAETTFTELLDQLRRARTLATRWQDCAVAADLAQLVTSSSAGFAYLPIGAVKPPLAEVAALSLPTAAVPLLLGIRAAEARLDGEVRYDPAAFDHADADDLAKRFTRVLASAINDPTARVSRLALLEDGERERLIAASLGPVHPNAEASTPVHRQFEQQAARSPDAKAVAAVGGALSYGELDRAANRLAHHLRSCGVVPGAPVGLCLERTPAMLVALLAILKQGGPYLPLNHEHPRARIAHQLAQSGACAVVTETHLLDRSPAFDGPVVCLDRDAQAIRAHPASPIGHEVQPDDLVYVMYTSGSTGTPKGVAVTHRNLANYAASIVDVLGSGGEIELEGLRFGVVSTISTDLGNTAIFPTLVSGGCVQLITTAASMDADKLVAELGGQPLDALKITPSHLLALLSADNSAVLPRGWLVLGGEALSWDLVAEVAQRSPGCRILNHYGPTETTVGCCSYPLQGGRRSDSLTVPIGFPLAGSRVYVLDAELEPVPPGVPGELSVGGAGVARGYVGAGEAEEQRFVTDPFGGQGPVLMYRTGDRARRLRDGAVEFLGRLDDQVKIRGHRIEPAEIEAALSVHPAIRQAAVTAEDAGQASPRLVAFVVGQQVPPVEDLQAFLRQSLPDYMVPARFASVDVLPLTPSGKVDRRALPGLAAVEARREAEYVAPRDEVEEDLAEIWRELLDVERVGVFDDFFALGGHSLLATQAIMRIRRVHGDIPLRALLAAPTVAALADVIRSAGLASARAPRQ